ncbi:MAG: S8 family peptidase, partial [Candidatus Beckwithbacteria bacterium]|nr:S8 family peptidase [Candidatus Beckwithbacteria bacterium]
TGINTSQVHYCRVIASKNEIEKILASYAGIISVEEAPFVVFGSGIQSKMGKYTIEDLSQNKKSIIVFDHPVCISHPIIKPLADNPLGEAYATTSESHGTQVASLVIFGSKISQSGKLTGRNKILPVNIFPISNGRPIFNENVIIDTLKQHSSPNIALIANLSINDYTPYSRKNVHRLTALLDELAVDYNCLFVISAGNLFKQWGKAETNRILSIGYPNYFKENVTTILSPADSINNLTVGSITYQASPNSVAPVGEPSPVTRRGFTDTEGFYFIKPDLVEYDSNFDSKYSCEDNGPFMAYPSDSLIRAAGTSFSTPLATHELGVLSQMYPEYTVNSLKALVIHFAKPITSNIQVPPTIAKSLVGYGLPDLERALYSLNTSSTIVIEDKIKVGTSKRLKVPIPSCISGSNRKRLCIRKTLVYNPKINNIDVKSYNPILLSARVIRNDGNIQNNATSRRYQDGAHRKSNVKTYNPIERSTNNHTGAFWEIEVMAEPVNNKAADDIEQSYSIVITIEDMQKDDTVDLHAEIQQMIEIEVGVNVNVEIDS